ncbi:MAG: hypothetical protein JSW27_20490 [Phycisphaerales bacterium]|nr:MAG: hypothetical protein JSW27_20490 [Phycisphaerales bacterium]
MPIQRDRRMKLPRSVCVLVLLLTVAVLGAQAVAAADALVVASGERSGIYPLGKEVVFTITSVEPIDLEEVNVTIVRDGFEKIPSWRTEKDGEGLEVRLTPKAAGWYMCDFTGPVVQRLGGLAHAGGFRPCSNIAAEKAYGPREACFWSFAEGGLRIGWRATMIGGRLWQP